MAPKKAPKNAYFFYMLEYQKMQKAKGINMSIPEASAAASDSWKNLSDKEKEVYKKMATIAKESETKAPGPPNIIKETRITSQGVPIQFVLAEKQRMENAHQNMKESITKMLADAKRFGGGIDKLVFHLIHMNMFYENYPCEVAVTKFSIGSGIIDTYHSLVKVPKLPLGSAFEAKQNAERIHGLPLPPNSLGNDDYFDILNGIYAHCVTKDKKCIIFCYPDHKENIENGIHFLDGGCASSNSFMIYDIVEAFHIAHKIEFCGEPRGDITYAAAQLLLDQDVFDSSVKGCPIHNELDLNLTCSESKVKRLAYQFIDAFVEKFGIKRTPELHIPSEIYQNDKDLVTLVNNLHVETSDEKTSTYDSESATCDEEETPVQKLLNKTNPFYGDILNETKKSNKSKDLVRQGLLENFGMDSDFDTMVDPEFDETEDHDVTFDHDKLMTLLKRVRQNAGNR